MRNERTWAGLVTVAMALAAGASCSHRARRAEDQRLGPSQRSAASPEVAALQADFYYKAAGDIKDATLRYALAETDKKHALALMARGLYDDSQLEIREKLTSPDFDQMTAPTDQQKLGLSNAGTITAAVGIGVATLGVAAMTYGGCLIGTVPPSDEVPGSLKKLAGAGAVALVVGVSATLAGVIASDQLSLADQKRVGAARERYLAELGAIGQSVAKYRAANRQSLALAGRCRSAPAIAPAELPLRGSEALLDYGRKFVDGLEAKPQLGLDNRLFLIKPVGGAANRLRAIAAADTLAQRTNRQLVIVWTYKEGEMVANFDDFLKPQSYVVISEADATRLKQRYERDPSADLRQTKSAFQSDLGGIYTAAHSRMGLVELESMIRFYDHGRWADPQLDGMIDANLRKLQPSERVESLYRDWQAQNFKDAYVIGVHYRAWGANTGDESFNLKKSPLEIYSDEAKKGIAAAKAAGHPNVKIFLATDDPLVREHFVRELGQDTVTFYPISKVDRTTVDGQVNGMVDFFLLSKTQYVIGTRGSSFSDEAAKYTVQRRKIDLGPNVW